MMLLNMLRTLDLLAMVPVPHYARDAIARSWRWPCHRRGSDLRRTFQYVKR
jgi:hypothetical protein